MTPSFQTKKGWLTRYALGCGYCELRELSLPGPNGTWWGDPSKYAGVRLDQISSNGTLRVWGIGAARPMQDWTGTNLKEARRVYAKAWREVKAKWGKPQS